MARSSARLSRTAAFPRPCSTTRLSGSSFATPALPLQQLTLVLHSMLTPYFALKQSSLPAIDFNRYVANKDSASVARKIAEESITLLKNSNQTGRGLPLKNLQDLIRTSRLLPRHWRRTDSRSYSRRKRCCSRALRHPQQPQQHHLLRSQERLHRLRLGRLWLGRQSPALREGPALGVHGARAAGGASGRRRWLLCRVRRPFPACRAG